MTVPKFAEYLNRPGDLCPYAMDGPGTWPWPMRCYSCQEEIPAGQKTWRLSLRVGGRKYSWSRKKTILYCEACVAKAKQKVNKEGTTKVLLEKKDERDGDEGTERGTGAGVPLPSDSRDN